LAFFKHTNWSALNDNELLFLYREKHDLNIIAELYGRYMEMLYSVCIKYLDDRETARDAVLQVFEELIAKLQKHEPENFKAWIYTVVKNHCLMQLRKPLNGKIVSMDTSVMHFAEEPHQDVVEKEMKLNSLSGCMERLSDEQKTSVQLFYLQEKCYKEIVEITGLSFDKVRSLIQNGRRNLKICMEKKIAQ
jgi:RNA polymerase sigma factor (sigma-70 family)